MAPCRRCGGEAQVTTARMEERGRAMNIMVRACTECEEVEPIFSTGTLGKWAKLPQAK